MPNVGPFEIVILLALALIVFGPKRLPELGNSLGRGIREFRGSISGEESPESQTELTDGGAPAAATTSAVAHATGEDAPAGEHESSA